MIHSAHTTAGDAVRLFAELAAERSNELIQYDDTGADIESVKET